MIAPIVKVFQLSPEVNFLIAVLIGIAFGFILEWGGFGNSRKLALQFYLKDFTVVKVMFTAIIVAMAGIIILGSIGILDLQKVYINTTYLWPGIIGGLIMGVGFAVGGYCPGTTFAGISTLKIDAFFYFFGLMIGMFVFGEAVPAFKEFFLSSNMGKVTLDIALGVKAGVIGFVVILIAIGMFFAGEYFEKKSGAVIK